VSRAWLGAGVEQDEPSGWFDLDPASSQIDNPEPVGQLANPEPTTNETDISLVDCAPVTEWIPLVPPAAVPTRLTTPEEAEAEHRAALADVYLPPPPLRELYLPPSPWETLRRWLVEVFTIGAGFVLGALAFTLIVGGISWLAR
jgi:hypothetical protein